MCDAVTAYVHTVVVLSVSVLEALSDIFDLSQFNYNATVVEMQQDSCECLC